MFEPFSSLPVSNPLNQRNRININNLTLNFPKKDDNNISSLKSLTNGLSPQPAVKLRRNERVKLRS